MAACIFHLLVALGAFKIVEALGVPRDSNTALVAAIGIYILAVSYLHNAIEADYRQKN